MIWIFGHELTLILDQNPRPPLTSLVGGDVDRDMLRRIRALVADAVDSLDLKAVEGMRQQVADEHPRFGQAQLSRDEVYIVVAVGAGPSVSTALLADDVVHDITAAAGLPGRVPLEDHRGLVDDGDDVPRAGGDACRQKGRRDSPRAAGKSCHHHTPACHNK